MISITIQRLGHGRWGRIRRWGLWLECHSPLIYFYACDYNIMCDKCST